MEPCGGTGGRSVGMVSANEPAFSKKVAPVPVAPGTGDDVMTREYLRPSRHRCGGPVVMSCTRRDVTSRTDTQ